MPSVFFFTGENTHGLREEKIRWMQEFVRKHGEENLIRLEGKGQTLRSLLDEVAMMPFLAERRLFVMEGAPKLSKEEVDLLVDQVHPQVILLIADSKPDKRLAGVKQLLAKADVKEFPVLKGPKLSAWLAAEARSAGTELDAGARDLLLEYVGEDQETLLREVEKLSLRAAGRNITRDDVERMTIPSDEGIVWKMTDLLSAGRKAEASSYVRRMLERGGEAYGLWAILLSFLKNASSVRIALEGGVTGQKEIAEVTGVHPFALRSLLPYVRQAEGRAFRDFLAWAAESDIRLKTGALRATDEAPEELHALIDRFVLRCP